MSMDRTKAERILGLTPPYTKEDVAKAYRKSVLVNHPDVGGDEKKMVEVNAAKDMLDRLAREGASQSEKANTRQPSKSRTTSKSTTMETSAQREKAQSKPQQYPKQEGEFIPEIIEIKTGDDADVVVDTRSTFRIGKRTYRFSPLWLSVLMRVIVFIAGIVGTIAYMGLYAPASLGGYIDLMFDTICLFFVDALFCGWVSRRILRLFRVFVRRKDASKFIYQNLHRT